MTPGVRFLFGSLLGVLAGIPPSFRTDGVAQTAAPTLLQVERPRVLQAADRFLNEKPVTVTASYGERNAGSRHDYFSEGDYWWPDPKNPTGPYIRRDGESNPANFNDHRRAMQRLSIQTAALGAAFRITRDERYARQVIRHARAWFVDAETRMNPHLRFAQAIQGVCTGRGTGIIDTIHLVEVVRAIEALEGSRSLSRSDKEAVRAWFRSYLDWITTHPYGIAERDSRNNHSSAWVFQAAAFARFVGDTAVTAFCRNRFTNVILAEFMNGDGGFPDELGRTKPYGYSIFHLDLCAGIAQLLSAPGDNLWTFVTANGRGMKKGLSFLFPYLNDKSAWPFKKDVQYWEEWPVRQASLLFGGLALSNPTFIDLWLSLRPEPATEEGIRNWPIRQPLLWLDPETVLFTTH